MQVNTYQGIIITNTIFSYFFFSYTCGEIQWSGLGFETAIVGYNSKANYFGNHPANGFEDIGQIVSCTRQVNSGRKKRNAGSTGNGITECVMPVDADLLIARQRCKEVADADDRNIPDINSIFDMTGNRIRVVDQVPMCPYSRSLALLSVGFQAFPELDGNCFQSVATFKPDIRANIRLGLQRVYTFASVCCYNALG